MEKIKQHYMIALGERNYHPIFRISYLPENLASLVETALLFLASFFAIILLPCMHINIFNIYTESNTAIFIYYSFMGEIFSFLHLPNNLASNLGVIVGFVTAYYLVRKYFEFVKYNLHTLRNTERK